MPSLKLATFNINNVATRLPVLMAWLTKASPDIVCLQELKTIDAAFPLKQIEGAGYGARWVGQRSWNGVAILARGMTPIETRRHFLAHAQTLHDTGHPVALVGDYNVVPTDFDIYNSRSWLKNALLQPEPRALYQRLLAQGWTDAIRARHPDDPVFTFWHYLRQAWDRNAGMRLDHILLSASLADGLSAAGCDAWVRGLPGASDHARVGDHRAPKRATGAKE